MPVEQQADGTAALPEASTTALLTVACRRGVVGEHSALPELAADVAIGTRYSTL